MANTKRARFIEANRKVKVYGGRGRIYSWLRTNHEDIEGLLAIHRNLWAELALDMVEDGVTEAAGGRAIRDRIWHTWQRVKRDVAAEPAAKAKKAPSPQGAPDWRPTVVAPPLPNWPAQRPVAPSGALVPVQPPGALAPEATSDVHPEIANAFAELNAQDKKRFRFGSG